MREVTFIGTDLVHIPGFAEQLARPGSRFAELTFTPAELTKPPHSLAARWAAKEAFIKAWSQSMYGHPPVLPHVDFRDIEVVQDQWGRVRIQLHGQVAELVDAHIELSMSHDADYATATVALTTR